MQTDMNGIFEKLNLSNWIKKQSCYCCIIIGKVRFQYCWENLQTRQSCYDQFISAPEILFTFENIVVHLFSYIYRSFTNVQKCQHEKAAVAIEKIFSLIPVQYIKLYNILTNYSWGKKALPQYLLSEIINLQNSTKMNKDYFVKLSLKSSLLFHTAENALSKTKQFAINMINAINSDISNVPYK